MKSNSGSYKDNKATSAKSCPEAQYKQKWIIFIWYLKFKRLGMRGISARMLVHDQIITAEKAVTAIAKKLCQL